MRKPEARTVITFHTTAEAMAAERLFRALDLPGKLIPVHSVKPLVTAGSDHGLGCDGHRINELSGLLRIFNANAPALFLRRRSLGFDGVYAMEL